MVQVLMKMDLPSDAELKSMFDAVAKLERYEVADKVTKAGIAPITKRSRQLMPRGNQKNRDKWSKDRKKGKGRWGGLNTPALHTTVRVVTRRGRQGSAYSITGPQFTGQGHAGSKIFFLAEHKQRGRRMVFWGKDGGRTQLKIRNVMVQAADETRSEQLSAMKSKLKTLMDQVWRG